MVRLNKELAAERCGRMAAEAHAADAHAEADVLRSQKEDLEGRLQAALNGKEAPAAAVDARTAIVQQKSRSFLSEVASWPHAWPDGSLRTCFFEISVHHNFTCCMVGSILIDACVCRRICSSRPAHSIVRSALAPSAACTWTPWRSPSRW